MFSYKRSIRCHHSAFDVQVFASGPNASTAMRRKTAGQQWWRKLSFTTFTCQAAVRKNETARSDVIVAFGLHVWKSFACGRRVGQHLLCTACRPVNKGLHGVGKQVGYTDYRFHEFGNCCSCLLWSWCRELWIMLHTVESIHSRRVLTFTACVDVACRLQSYKHTNFTQVSLAQCWKTLWRLPLNIACVCKCLGGTFGDTSVKIFNLHWYFN